MSERGSPPPKYAEAPLGGTKDGLDPLLLGSVGILLFGLVAVVVYLWMKQREDTEARKMAAALRAALGEDEAVGGREANMAGGVRRRNVRRRVNYGDEDDVIGQMAGDQMDEEDGFEGPSHEPGVGKKKAAKLEAKAAKKAAREQELIEREERKKREQERQEKLDKEREKERLEEEAEEERLKKKREEKARQEHEEYLKMKESFAVQEEGFDQIDGEEAESLIKNFLDYVKTNKVVNMDELASQFNLRVEDVVDRLKHFIETKELTGVMDDRGKFIYITDDELAAVAKFINQCGRVSIAELADYSNRLIKLET